MRAFICVGIAIILGLIAIGITATRCERCCDGQPCLARPSDGESA